MMCKKALLLWLVSLTTHLVVSADGVRPDPMEVYRFQERVKEEGAVDPRLRYATDAPTRKHPSQFKLSDHLSRISHEGLRTYIPKGAVLYCCPTMKGRLASGAGGKIVKFDEFLRRNRAWLKTFEITREQARGNEPLPQSFYEKIKNTEQIVVAKREGSLVSTSIPMVKGEVQPQPDKRHEDSQDE